MHKPVHPKVKAVALVSGFFTALGTALAAAGELSWAVVGAAVVTAAGSTIAGYWKSA